MIGHIILTKVLFKRYTNNFSEKVNDNDKN